MSRRFHCDACGKRQPTSGQKTGVLEDNVQCQRTQGLHASRLPDKKVVHKSNEILHQNKKPEPWTAPKVTLRQHFAKHFSSEYADTTEFNTHQSEAGTQDNSLRTSSVGRGDLVRSLRWCLRSINDTKADPRQKSMTTQVGGTGSFQTIPTRTSYWKSCKINATRCTRHEARTRRR